jgi:2,4-dienoyl-CoA reductase-like NADH-dependent reductase (Old Yellow Enzyme family)
MGSEGYFINEFSARTNKRSDEWGNRRRIARPALEMCRRASRGGPRFHHHFPHLARLVEDGGTGAEVEWPRKWKTRAPPC